MPARTDRILLDKLREFLRSVEGRRHPQQLAIETEDERAVGSAEPNRASATVSNTARRSNAERLMTSSTSAVAVCCSSRFAQLALSSRVFSIAMTA